MPTEQVKFLDTDVVGGSGDGSSLANAYPNIKAAYDGIEAAWPDFVTSDVNVVLKARGLANDSSTTTTFHPNMDATRDLVIINDSGLDPAIWDSGCYQWHGTSNTDQMIHFNNGSNGHYITYDGIQFFRRSGTATSSSRRVIRISNASGGVLTVRNCYAKSDGGNTGTGAFDFLYMNENLVSHYIENSIFEDFEQSNSDPGLLFLAIASSINVYFVSNTVINCGSIGRGQVSSRTLWRLINTLCKGSSGADIESGTYHADSDYNVTDKTDAASNLPGTNNTYSHTASFVSTTDRHLSSANNLGTGPSAESLVPTTDIDGDTRGLTVCDAGADEFISSGASIVGDITTTFSIAATMEHQSHHAIVGAVTVSFSVSATLDFTGTPYLDSKLFTPKTGELRDEGAALLPSKVIDFKWWDSLGEDKMTDANASASGQFTTDAAGHWFTQLVGSTLLDGNPGTLVLDDGVITASYRLTVKVG